MLYAKLREEQEGVGTANAGGAAAAAGASSGAGEAKPLRVALEALSQLLRMPAAEVAEQATAEGVATAGNNDVLKALQGIHALLAKPAEGTGPTDAGKRDGGKSRSRSPRRDGTE